MHVLHPIRTDLLGWRRRVAHLHRRLRSKVQDVSSNSKPAVTKSPAGKEQPIKKHLLGMQQPMPAAHVTAAAVVPLAVALRDTLHMKGRDVIFF